MIDFLSEVKEDFITRYNLENENISTPNNKKIAIIGKGTASLFQCCCFLENGINNIDVFYDPNKPELPVGESTTPIVAQILLSTLGITIGNLHQEGLASYKTSVKFFNWGTGKSFEHYFHSNQQAFHFFTHDFNAYITDILKSKGVNFIEEKIASIEESDIEVLVNQKKYDFVIHASGWNDTISSYKDADFSTVNSAIVFTANSNTSISQTVHRAHENGWQFELPFPEKNLSRCGFLYDKNFLSKEEAIKKLDSNYEYKLLEWKPRYSKNILITKRQSLVGNALFFIEPLQAFSTFYYIKFGRYISSYIKNFDTSNSFFSTNLNYYKSIKNYQIILALHYSFGSIYETCFWKNITEKANSFLIENNIDKNFYIDYANYCSDNNIIFPLEGFHSEDYKRIYYGMQGKF